MAVDMMLYRYFNEILFFEETMEGVISNVANTETEMPLFLVVCLHVCNVSDT